MNGVRVAALLATLPRWEPYAVMPLVRFCARGRSAMVVPTATTTLCWRVSVYYFVWISGTTNRLEAGGLTSQGSSKSFRATCVGAKKQFRVTV